MHAIFVNRNHFVKLTVALTCNCLSHKPTLQTSRELGNNVKYKQCITRHHTIRTAYNYHWGYGCDMVSYRICIGYHGNMLYCIQGGPTKQLSWIITPITSNNCWATIVNRVYEPTYNWWLACIM